MAKKLLSLPPNLVGCFHDITGLSKSEFTALPTPSATDSAAVAELHGFLKNAIASQPTATVLKNG